MRYEEGRARGVEPFEREGDRPDPRIGGFPLIDQVPRRSVCGIAETLAGDLENHPPDTVGQELDGVVTGLTVDGEEDAPILGQEAELVTIDFPIGIVREDLSPLAALGGDLPEADGVAPRKDDPTVGRPDARS